MTTKAALSAELRCTCASEALFHGEGRHLCCLCALYRIHSRVGKMPSELINWVYASQWHKLDYASFLPASTGINWQHTQISTRFFFKTERPNLVNL